MWDLIPQDATIAVDAPLLCEPSPTLSALQRLSPGMHLAGSSAVYNGDIPFNLPRLKSSPGLEVGYCDMSMTSPVLVSRPTSPFPPSASESSGLDVQSLLQRDTHSSRTVPPVAPSAEAAFSKEADVFSSSVSLEGATLGLLAEPSSRIPHEPERGPDNEDGLVPERDQEQGVRLLGEVRLFDSDGEEEGVDD
jgi:hypothetical protein